MNYVLNVFVGFIVVLILISLIGRDGGACSKYSTDPGQCATSE